ncbi:ribulose-phosphate 3-epimerase [Nocardia thraciensis]
MTVSVAPALLGADPLHLQAAIDAVNDSNAPYLHLDIMDGHYTHDISFGLRTITAIRDHTQLPLDVHLQTIQPDRYVDDLVRIGVDRVSLHIDAATDIDATLDTLQTAGVRKGLVLNPDLGIARLAPYLGRLDFVILMTSQPGTSTFDPTVPDKIRKLRTILQDRYLDTVELVADGGVTGHTAPKAIEAGVDTLVAASAVFKSPDTDIQTAIDNLTKSGNPAANVGNS